MSMNQKFLEVQNQIRQNSYSVNEYISDLTDWTEEIHKKDNDVRVGKGVKVKKDKQLPPIRSVALENERLKHNSSGAYLDTLKSAPVSEDQKHTDTENPNDVNDYKRDVTPMPNYYQKWDRYDVEEGIRAVENDASVGFDRTLNKSGNEITKTSSNSKMYEGTPIDDDLTEEERKLLEKEKFLKGTSGAKPNTKMIIKGGAQPTPMSKIDSVKTQGNNYFKTCDYLRAIDSYTKCLQMNPDDEDVKVVLYSNRSQCYLNVKDYKSAEQDALSALRLDKLHVKSLFRHGTALYYLKRYKESKREFNNLLKIDNKVKGALERLQQVEQKLSQIKQQAYENLKYGEIVGDITSSSVDVIAVEEINLPDQFKQKLQDAKGEQVVASQSPDEPKSTNDVSKKTEERESKKAFLSKTDVSNISRSKDNQKDLSAFVENSEEQEELRKLEQERQSKSKRKKNRKGKNKNKSKVAVTGDITDPHPAPEAPPASDVPAEIPKISLISESTDDVAVDNEVNDEDELESPVRNHTKEEPHSPPPRSRHFQKTILSEPNICDTNANGDTEFAISLHSDIEGQKLVFDTMHEIQTDRYSQEVAEQIHRECEQVKSQIHYDEDQEHVKVVKADDGEFYVIRHSKQETKPKSILKARSTLDEELASEESSDNRASVFFNLQDNEVRDFKKGDKVTWQPFTLKQSVESPKPKKEKKVKGKGKNRRKNQEDKEQKKIRKAEERRKEQEELERIASEETKQTKGFNMSTLGYVADDFNEDEELEACNAPSTRKHSSMPTDLVKSPFFGDSLVDFTSTAHDEDDVKLSKLAQATKVAKAAYQYLEVPTKASQLEKDLRGMKDDYEEQRKYLTKIDPSSLKTIFKSSLEYDTLQSITAAFSSASKTWINSKNEYLADFLYNLSQVERFDMNFCDEDDKIPFRKLVNRVEESILADKEKIDADDDESKLDALLEKLDEIRLQL